MIEAHRLMSGFLTTTAGVSSKSSTVTDIPFGYVCKQGKKDERYLHIWTFASSVKLSHIRIFIGPSSWWVSRIHRDCVVDLFCTVLIPMHVTHHGHGGTRKMVQVFMKCSSWLACGERVEVVDQGF